ncbi:MAG: hypothetical protein J6A75_13470 [Lachnospiraceae bacterium]|nr:hypothetical protein [Lachnospiraceae bacterium]
MGRVSLYDEKAKSERVFWIRLIAILFLIVFVVNIIVMNFWESSITATITVKEMTSNHKFIYITTEDGDELVLDNRNAPFRLKFDSAEIYGDLEVGSTYEFTTIGIRSQFLGLYENIIGYTLVEDAKNASDNTDMIKEMNEKKEQGFTVVISVGEGILDAEDDFTFTEEIFSEYSVMVDYDNKSIILTEK